MGARVELIAIMRFPSAFWKTDEIPLEYLLISLSFARRASIDDAVTSKPIFATLRSNVRFSYTLSFPLKSFVEWNSMKFMFQYANTKARRTVWSREPLSQQYRSNQGFSKCRDRVNKFQGRGNFSKIKKFSQRNDAVDRRLIWHRRIVFFMICRSANIFIRINPLPYDFLFNFKE